LVDPERLALRLGRLDTLLARLERVREGGVATYLADPDVRLVCERALTVCEQIVLDVAAQVVAERGLAPPTDYASAFATLAQAGLLDAELADGLADAARQRNLLVHLYLTIDDRLVFASLERLDHFRRFAATALSF